MFLTQALAAKQMNEEQRKAFTHADSAFDPYKPYERKEMSLNEMMNMQYLTFQSYQEIVQLMPLSLMDYLRFADFQNQTVIQISRCLVSAAVCGEELDRFYEAENLINAMLCEMSYHARRIFDQGCVRQFGLKFYQSANTLLAEVLTTLRRLKATRKKFQGGAFKVSYQESKPAAAGKSAGDKSAAPARPVNSAFHAEAAFPAERSISVPPAQPAADEKPVEKSSEKQPQEALEPAPAFEPDAPLCADEENAHPLSAASPNFLALLGICDVQADDLQNMDLFLELDNGLALPSRASP